MNKAKPAGDPLPQKESAESFFSSARESRLWFWTIAVVVAIYATRGLASTVAGILPETLAAIGFLGGMFLVGLTVLTQGLKTRPNGVEVAVVLGVATAYLLIFLRMTIPERSHLIEYGIVAAFIYEALTERASNGRRVPFPALIAILATTTVGTIDEFIQYFLPSRVFDNDDILFNFLAAGMAVSSSALIGWARRRFVKPANNT